MQRTGSWFTILLAATFLVGAIALAAQQPTAGSAFLPIVQKPLPRPTNTPTPTPIPDPFDWPLRNGSFENGWVDLPPVGSLINQQPTNWTLSWVPEGEPLYDANDLAGGVPECVHKLSWQLPEDEQLGGPNALILHGEATYKIFHSAAPFGAELRQTITGLTPGAAYLLQVPILVTLNGDPDPFGAESGVWVDGVGDWVNADVMGDRTWYTHQQTIVVPADGSLEVVIQVKTKWNGKDFFIDGAALLPAVAPTVGVTSTTATDLEIGRVTPTAAGDAARGRLEATPSIGRDND